MNYIAKLVRDYHNSGLDKRQFDTDTLTICVENLSDEDAKYIVDNRSATIHTGDPKFKFFMKQLLHRYNDLINGYTKVDADGCIEFTMSSSIIELCDSIDAYRTCKNAGIRRMRDITQENVKDLPMDIVSQLMAGACTFSIREGS